MNEGRKKREYVLLEAGIVLLSILDAFGNYITAIFCMSSYLFLVFWAFFKKIRGRLVITIDAVIFTVSFIVNATAPGNKVRQAVVGEPEAGPVKAIIKSLIAAAEYLVCNLYPTVIVIMIMMIPFIIVIVRFRAFGEGKAFRFPLFFTVISFGLYASQFVPTTYALGDLVSGRVLNLYRITMYEYLFANLIYWIGWLTNSIHLSHPEIKPEALSPAGRYLILSMAAGFAIFCFAAYFYGGKTLTTVSAIGSLKSGQARLYRDEYERRLEILNDDNVKDAVLDEFTDPPYLLYFGDLMPERSSVNADMEKFYGKDSVTLRLWK